MAKDLTTLQRKNKIAKDYLFCEIQRCPWLLWEACVWHTRWVLLSQTLPHRVLVFCLLSSMVPLSAFAQNPVSTWHEFKIPDDMHHRLTKSFDVAKHKISLYTLSIVPKSWQKWNVSCVACKPSCNKNDSLIVKCIWTGRPWRIN